MKILIFVLTYLDGGIYESFYKRQTETWNTINYDDIKVYFYVGGGDKQEINGDLIINNLPETVPNEAYKLINCFEQTLDWEYDYVFHTNSSSYIDKKLLYKWLLDKPREKFYSGVVGNYHNYPFASGCGFTISKDVVKLILENQNDWEHGNADDATLGVLLSNLGLNVYPAPRYDIIDNTNIPNDFFHYRLKTNNRYQDIENMSKVFNIKTN